MFLAQARTLYRSAAGRVPFNEYKREQAKISRRRLYPMTAFYSVYSAIVLILGARSAHPWIALGFYFLGVPTWTLGEYLFHRYVLHGRFPLGKGIVRRFLHERLDPLHWDHHRDPLDGWHISGELKDILPLFFIAAPASFLFPLWSLPMLLGGVVQSYVIEEWVHHSVHFYRFRNPYFKYMRKHHFYHHSPEGANLGYGLTSGVWDVVFKTRYPLKVRKALYGGQSFPKSTG